MARPRTISDEHLLTAARELFVEQGFSATTAAIARRAGVSEGTLFKRFSTKEELFAAAMGLGEYGLWRGELLLQVGRGDVRRNLERATLAQLEEAGRLVPLLMTVFSRGYDPEHNPLLQKLEYPAHQDAQALADYLRGETGLGRVRPHDAEVVALSVMGAVSHYVHREVMLPSDRTGTIDSGRFVRGLFDVLWPGLGP